MPDRPGLPHGKNLVLLAGLTGGIAGIVLVIAIVFAVTQDDDILVPTPTPGNGAIGANDVESTQVDLAIRSQLDGGRLLVEGTITVPDGALVKYEITGPEDCDECFAEGRVPVSDQAFRLSRDVSAWPDGTYEIRTSFQTVLNGETQPGRIIELYGETGERMTGDTIEEDGYTRVEAVDTVTP